MADPKDPEGLTRREMIVQSGIAFGAVLQKTAAPVREGELKTLTRLEHDTLDAICARLIPSDENGPGAREARAARYIDWGLSGALNVGNTRDQYAAALAAVEAFALSNKGASFAKLSPVDQDAVVTLLQNSQIPNAPMGFFNTIRTHTIQGTFSDPYYGGNYNGIGWDILKYPGVRTTVPAEYQQWNGPLKPNRQSAYDHEMFGKGEL